MVDYFNAHTPRSEAHHQSARPLRPQASEHVVGHEVIVPGQRCQSFDEIPEFLGEKADPWPIRGLALAGHDCVDACPPAGEDEVCDTLVNFSCLLAVRYAHLWVVHGPSRRTTPTLGLPGLFGSGASACPLGAAH